MGTAPAVRASGRSSTRRAELIAIGRTLFADRPYDGLSVDDIARHAGVAKGLIYYYFKSKRGYYLAIVQDSVSQLIDIASSHPDLPPAERAYRTMEAYLRYAEHHQAAYRSIVTGGIGFDAEVFAIRDQVREDLMAAIAHGAWGSSDVPPLLRTALIGWMSGVEGATLEWLKDRELSRDVICMLLVRGLGDTLLVVHQLDPSCPAPPSP